MLNILVEKNKGSYWSYYWKLYISLDVFKKFIDESSFNSEQKEEYLLLYKRGLYTKRATFVFAFLIFVFVILHSIWG
jgi:hypothetical protein